MQKSANYALKLFEGTDNVKRQDFVDNFQNIDSTMKSIDNNKAPSGYGLGTAATDISGKDLNNIVSTGFYRGSRVTNAPSNQWFYFIVMQHSDNNWNWQYAITFGTNNDANKIYSRVKANGTWTSWKQIVTTDMIPSSLPANGGNAATANKISTARKINGVAFDGSGDITITANPNAHTHDDRYYTESEINTKVDALNNAINGKASTSHNHTLASLSEKSYNSLTDKPTALPANGGNADTVGGKSASDLINLTLLNTNCINNGNIDNLTDGGFSHYFNASGSMPSGYTSGDNDFVILTYQLDLSSHKWMRQTLWDVRNPNVFTREKNNGTWTSWKRILNEDDYNALYNLANNSKVSECVPTTLNGWRLGYHFNVTRIGNTVTVCGAVMPGTVANLTDIFKLPNGFKPSADSDYVAVCPYLNNDLRQNSIVYFRILTSGTCTYISSTPTITNGGSTQIALDFTFRGV